MYSKPIKTGLASFGLSGKVFHAPFVALHPGFELTAVVQRSGNDVLQAYPATTLLRTVEQLIAHPELELIVVNTPDHTHYEFARQALLAGKHVVVEKPFVQHTAQGYELIQLAQQKGLMLSVYHNRRWDNDFLTIQQVLGQGLLGRLVEFESNFMRYRNYIVPNTWKELPGRGLTVDLGSHMIDQALQLFGTPQSVYADIDCLRSGSQIDDYYHLKLIYPQVKVNLRGSMLVREATPRYVLHGTLGSFLKYGMDPQEQRLREGALPLPGLGVEDTQYWGLLHTQINGEEYRQPWPSIEGCYMRYYEGVHQAIRAGAPAPVTAQEGLSVIRVIEAAFRSVQSGREEELQPQP